MLDERDDLDWSREALDRATRAVRIVVLCGRARIRARDERELLGELCSIAVEQGGYVQAYVGYDRAEAGETGTPVAQAGTNALAKGYTSRISLPLNVDGRAIGSFTVHARDADVFDAEEMGLLTALTDDIGYGIGALRLRAKHRDEIAASTAMAEIYRATFDHAPVGIMHNAADTEAVLKVNPKMCAMLGYSENELLELKVADIIHHEDRHTDRPKYRQQMLDGELETYSSERRLARKDGSALWVYRTISLVRDAHGAPSYFIRMMEDISERKRAEEAISVERALLRTVVDTIPERIYAKDREGRFRLQNVANVKAHGAAAAGELLGKTVFDVFPPDVAARMEAEDRTVMESGIPILDRERMVTNRLGEARWVASSKVPLPDGNGNIIGIVGVSRDITDRKRIEQELTHLAHFDVLTGLPNRASFGERLSEALAYARTNGWTTGVMFVDLDRFKEVNDTLGHAEGDKLLKQAAERLVQAVRRGDTVARLGGDEFAVVLTNLAAGEDAEIVARKIVASLAQPFQLAGTEARVSASIGISLCPGDALDEDGLVRSADAAMYEAKKAGRNGYRFLRHY